MGTIPPPTSSSAEAPDFQRLFEAAPGRYLVLTPDFRIVAATDAYLAATMTRREEILGRGLFEVFPDNPSDPGATGVANLQASLERVLALRRPDFMPVQKYDIRRPESQGGTFEERHWSPLNVPVLGPRGEVAYILHRVEDVTEYVHLHQKGQAQELFLFRVVESLPGIFYAITDAGRFFLWNTALEVATGYTPGEISRLHPLDLIPEEERPAAAERLSEVFAKGFSKMETRLLRKDGTRVPYYFTGRAVLHEGQRLAVGMGLDISDRVKAEAAFLQAQKLESLGTLAGGIAHDLNNALTAMIGNVELAELSLPGDHEAQAHLAQVMAAIERATVLGRQMLAYSGKGAFRVGLLDLNDVVFEVAVQLKPSLSRHIELDLDLGADLAPVKADASQVRQALLCVAVNAAEALGDRPGLVTIRTLRREVASSPEPSLAGLTPQPGSYVCVEVEDSGPGIDPDLLPKVFDPLFSTKFAGRGLGLAALLGIMRSNRGAVTVRSRPGDGTCFRLYFPVTATAEAEGPRAEPPGPQAAGAESVLVVDDEESLRRVLAVHLQRLGYRVIQAADGREGVAQFRAHAEEIHTVFLDLMMPELDGLEAARRIRELKPGARIVLMSGYARDRVADPMDLLGIQGFLQKPFGRADLEERLRSLVAVP